MKINKAILLTALCAVFTSAHADSFVPPSAPTAPDVDYQVRWNSTYRNNYNQIYAVVPSLTTLVTNFLAAPDSTKYELVEDAAIALAATVTNGRVVVTLADGTVLVDTRLGDAGNTYAIFSGQTLEGAVVGYHSNYNTRLCILDAQEWPGGVGVENITNFDTATGAPSAAVTAFFTDFCVAVRLGAFHASVGTVMLTSRP